MRFAFFVFIAFLVTLSITGCTASNSAISAKASKTKTSKKEKPRLISFAPSNTELIYSIGAEDTLIATCNQCLYPENAREKARAGSFTTANFEVLATLNPDMALLVSGQEALSSQLERHGFKNSVLPNTKLEDITDNLKTLGKLSGRTKDAEEKAQGFNQALTQLSEILKDRKRPKILFCIWVNPSMCIGKKSFLNDVITICGADNATAYLDVSYPKLTAEKIISLNPEILVLPYEAKRDNLTSRPPWSSLKAVKSKRVLYLPEAKDDFLSRPTLRIISGLHWLAARIHPEKSENLKKWLDANRYLFHLRTDLK